MISNFSFTFLYIQLIHQGLNQIEPLGRYMDVNLCSLDARMPIKAWLYLKSVPFNGNHYHGPETPISIRTPSEKAI